MTISSISDVPVNYTAALAAVGLRGDDPRSQAVVLVCSRYGLDPILKHVVLVEGNVYVTRDGLMHIAHASQQLDGLEVEQATLSDDGKEWRSRATVHRKDMGRPISLAGRFPAGRKNSPEMAEKVAVARTLRHAFDVAIATEEERQVEAAQPQQRRVTAESLRRPEPPAVEPAPVVADDDGVIVEDPPAELWPETAQPPA